MIIHKIVPKLAQKKVAAYARVSTLTEAQEESYETQVHYYTGLIQSTEGWSLAGIYADQGITGTSAAKRPEFLRMIEDAKAGKINIILCKSISRFSRNFVEAQKYVHALKAVNVEVRFEKEGISSFDPSSDMIFSTMAAVAQEESRSLSDNVKWGNKRRMEMGIRHVGSNHMLGYDEVQGKLIPNEDAWIVRLIFEEYAAGVAPTAILQHLLEKGAHRMRSEKKFTWSVVLRILNNEAYVGDRLLQKAAPQNYLTKRPDLSEAYESKYIYNDHEAIITPAVWDAAHDRFKREQMSRQQGLKVQHNTHFLYGKVFCAECGEPYRRFTARNGGGYYKTWRCRGRVNTGKCECRHVKESDLLAEIAGKMGWKWQDEESFDSWAFLESVDKVLVSNAGVEIIAARGVDYNERAKATA
ncbi:MAG: recombinase family protein [Clostridia bacterium]|nr:recombinase family protein [Clostridia bacterium]